MKTINFFLNGLLMTVCSLVVFSCDDIFLNESGDNSPLDSNSDISSLATSPFGEDNSNGLGYVSVNGEKHVFLNYAYQADMEGVGMGKANWWLFEAEQTIGHLNYEQNRVSIRGAKDQKGVYPFSIFIPGEGLYLDGIRRDGDGSLYFKKLAHLIKDGEEPEYVTYHIVVNSFSYVLDQEDTSLTADLIITSDASDSVIQIVFSGPAPNDGETYRMD